MAMNYDNNHKFLDYVHGAILVAVVTYGVLAARESLSNWFGNEQGLTAVVENHKQEDILKK